MSKRAQDKVLEINAKVYEEYRDKLIKKQLVHQDLKDMVMLGLNDPEGKLNLSDEQKLQLETYLASGVLDETEDVPDWEVAKEFEAELDRRLEEAIKNGELPKYALSIIKKKTRKYVRRTKASSGEVHKGEKDTSVGIGGDGNTSPEQEG